MADTGMTPDASTNDASSDCSTGVVFANKASISSWPNVPSVN